MQDKSGYVYILANKRNGTLYIGVTSDLQSRVYQHKNNLADGFTKKYQVHTLVWYRQSDSITSAIEKEKKLKRYKRAWKIQLIEESNPTWQDLSDSL